MENKKKEKYYCPVADWSCPYFKRDGSCELGRDALEECDDAACYDDTNLYEEKEEE